MKTTSLLSIFFLTASTACLGALAAPIGKTAVQNAAVPQAIALVIPTPSQKDEEVDSDNLDDATSDVSDDEYGSDSHSEMDFELDRRGGVRSILPKAASAARKALNSRGKSKGSPRNNASSQDPRKALTKSAGASLGRRPRTRKVKPQTVSAPRQSRSAQPRTRTAGGSKTSAAPKKARASADSHGSLGGKTRPSKIGRSEPLSGKPARMSHGPSGSKQHGSRTSSNRSTSASSAQSASLQQKASGPRAQRSAGCKRSGNSCPEAGPSRPRPRPNSPPQSFEMGTRQGSIEDDEGKGKGKGKGKERAHSPANSSPSSPGVAPQETVQSKSKSWNPFKSSKQDAPVLPLTVHDLPKVPTGDVSEADERRRKAHNDAVNTHINLYNSQVQAADARDQRYNRWCETGVKVCGLAGIGFAGYKALHGRSLEPESFNLERRTVTDVYYLADR